jgi:hypothetical protein
MAKDDERPLTLLGQMHADAVGIDKAVTDRVHRDLRMQTRAMRVAGRFRRLPGGNRFDPSHDVRFLAADSEVAGAG